MGSADAGSPGTDFAVETQDLHKAFGSHRILRGVNLAIPEGRMSVILGPSGTGKSVMIKHILGLLKPDAGEVMVLGTRLSHMSNQALLDLRRDVGVMFQDGALFSSMDVFDNVAFPLRKHTDMNETEVEAIVEAHLSGVGLADARHRMPGELSGGMRKRCGLARALALDPPILLCDEPDSGLDPVRTALLGELLRDRHDALGGTVITVTHNIALARGIADHVSLLWQGRIVDSGPAEEMFSSDDPFVRQFLAGGTVGPLGMD